MLVSERAQGLFMIAFYYKNIAKCYMFSQFTIINAIFILILSELCLNKEKKSLLIHCKIH